ncbi:MAG: radical SAM protein [Candidatus Omnitrophota bacterium]|nr:radical SAM protein [Candidatus Omnitrophota bacterium]
MLRVLLIGPFKGRDNSGDSFLAPSFGLYRMKFYIEKKLKRIRIDILDPNIDNYKEIKEMYDVIGFSLLHLTLENDLLLFNYFKLRFPDAIFIAGGPEVSFLGKKSFEYALFDIIVLGEGEKTLLKILEAIVEGKREFSSIRSIYWRDKDKIFFSGYGKQLTLRDFKEIYEAYGVVDVPYNRYWRHNASLYNDPDLTEIRAIRVLFSNFCPLRCKFCSSTNFISYSYSGKFRGQGHFYILPVEDIIHFILNITDTWSEVETIIFDDDNLFLDFKCFEELCLRIIALKEKGRLEKDLSFICQGRPDDFSGPKKEILGLMKKAGFRMIMYGVESFSNRVLAYLKKGVTRQQIIRSIDVTIEAGITPLIYIILLPPCISKEDLIETADLCVKQMLKNVEISTTLLVMDIPGSEFYYDDSLKRITKEYSISNSISIKKSDYIWPSNASLFKLGKNIYENYPVYEKRFKQKYGIKHVPSRIYSYIVLDAVYKELGLENKRKYLRKISEDVVKNYR